MKGSKALRPLGLGFRVIKVYVRSGWRREGPDKYSAPDGMSSNLVILIA